VQRHRYIADRREWPSSHGFVRGIADACELDRSVADRLTSLEQWKGRIEMLESVRMGLGIVLLSSMVALPAAAQEVCGFDIFQDDCVGEYFELPGGIQELTCDANGCASCSFVVDCDLANGFANFIGSEPAFATATLQFVAEGIDASFRVVGIDDNGQTVSGSCIAIAQGETGAIDSAPTCDDRVVALRAALLVE
jgi:hypothetical protein